MLTLVIGGPSSGKSQAAEQIAVSKKTKYLYYLATMKVYDREGEERIKRHRELRQGKGFITIEEPLYIQNTLRLIKKPKESVVLLECISNLLGNRLYEIPENKGFADWTGKECEDFATDILNEIKGLSESLFGLVAVTNEYPGKEEYDRETLAYIGLQNRINRMLIDAADETIDLRKDGR